MVFLMLVKSKVFSMTDLKLSDKKFLNHLNAVNMYHNEMCNNSFTVNYVLWFKIHSQTMVVNKVSLHLGSSSICAFMDKHQFYKCQV